MDKQMQASEVVGRLRDGMTLGIGGWGPRRKPMALVREILRSDLKDLTVVAYGGADVGMLCAAGKVKKLVFAFVSLDFIPLEPFFRKARQEGSIEVSELDEGMMLLGLRAAAWGLPFIPTEIGLGTDIIKMNSELKLVDSPYDDKEWVAVPALKLDASLVHVDRADARGVCQIAGPDHYLADMFARAATETFVSCAALVDTDFFNDPDQAGLGRVAEETGVHQFIAGHEGLVGGPGEHVVHVVIGAGDLADAAGVGAVDVDQAGV